MFQVHSSPYLSVSDCEQSVEHDETGVSNQNISLKTDPTSEAVTQLEFTTNMEQQAENMIEEDLCEMEGNILDYKQLSEVNMVSSLITYNLKATCVFYFSFIYCFSSVD
jgi:hypothetical protein